MTAPNTKQNTPDVGVESSSGAIDYEAIPRLRQRVQPGLKVLMIDNYD